MTNMKPGELRVKDHAKKELRKAQAIRAFESYQKLQTENRPPIVRHSPAHNQIQNDSGRDTISSRSATKLNNETRSQSMPNLLTVPLLSSDEGTPAGSIPEMQTPQCDMQFVAPLDIYKDSFVREPSLTPLPAGSPAQTIIPNGGKKRHAPLEFDLVAPNSTKRAPDFCFNPSMELEGLSAPSNEASDPDIMTCVIPNPQDNTRDSDDLDIVVEGRSSAVTKLEDKMLVPHGFIDFFKHVLTITRPSVASGLSSSGSVRSRWSHKISRQALPTLSEPTQEPGQLLFSQYPASQSQLEHQSPQITTPKMPAGQATTKLFGELLLAGKTDIEIAERLQTLIDAGADVNARNPHGETPLHIALRLGNRPACQVLLKYGADVYVKTKNGKSLSEYGKIAQNKTGDDTKLYLAIKDCRNLIKEHNPHGKAHGGSKIAPTTTAPSTASKNLFELGGDSSGGSWTNPPNESMTGELEVCQQHPTKEYSLMNQGKNFTGTIQSNENASQSPTGQSTFPVDWQQQSSHSRRHGFGTQLKYSLNCPSPTKLSGYLKMLPTGQMALLCPISDDINWQYVGQAPNSYSPAMIKIISSPELASSTIMQNPYIIGNGGSSSAHVPQVWTPQTATMIPSTSWVDSSPAANTHHTPHQQFFMGTDAIVIEPAKNRNNILTTPVGGGDLALYDGYVGGGDYSPGIYS
jgi:hypothetical protein